MMPTSADKISEMQAALEAASQDDLPRLRDIKMTRKLREFLALLMKRERVHKEVVFATLYANVMPEERPNIQALLTYVCNLRNKLRPLGVVITGDQNDYTWAISADHKRLIKAAMENGNAPPAIRPPRVFTVEKGVPIPSRLSNNSIYPFAAMEVGDSFLAHDVKMERLRSACNGWKKTSNHPDWFFTVRTADGGSRIWRTK